MNDHHREKKLRFKCTKLVTFVCGLFSCVVASGALASNNPEQFALVGPSGIYLDGGSRVLTGIHNGIPYEIIQGFAVAQGDMVLGKVLPNGKLDVPIQSRGLGQNSLFDRWPDGVIPYQFTDSVTQLQTDRAIQAIAHWNKNTKIKMIPRTESNAENYDNYISFELGGGCASYVGMVGGEQSVWLADNCTVGSIVHEIGHAIGLFHEHTRPDRDNHVTVNLQNVSAEKAINFDKVEVGASTYSEYDYGSIMHYGEFFFSSNGERTISVPDNISIGQRDALSAKDISSINNMYATDLKLSVSTTSQQDDALIDLVVTNSGELGAYDLNLTANWGDKSDWVSFSTDSGWKCQQNSIDLLCTRTTLTELSDSSFSILATPNNTSIDDLKIRIESRTLDTDLSNNVFNDTINTAPVLAETDDTGTIIITPAPEPNGDLAKENEPDGTTEPTGETITIIEPTNEITTITNNTSTNNTNTNPPELSAAQDGGGGAAFYLCVLLAGIPFRWRQKPLQQSAEINP